MIEMPILIEIVGWLGAAIVVAAYALVSYGRVDGRNPAYQAFNILGALLLTVNSVWHRALPSAATNIIWTVIAVGALAAARPASRRCEIGES